MVAPAFALSLFAARFAALVPLASDTLVIQTRRSPRAKLVPRVRLWEKGKTLLELYPAGQAGRRLREFSQWHLPINPNPTRLRQ